MMDIQFSEFLVIALVALVVFGPRRLPEIARKLGGWTAELRKAAIELRKGLSAELAEIEEPLKDVSKELEAPLREIRKDLTVSVRELDEELRAADKELRKAAGGLDWVGPPPTSGPRPEDALADLAAIERTGGPVTEPEIADGTAAVERIDAARRSAGETPATPRPVDTPTGDMSTGDSTSGDAPTRGGDGDGPAA